MYVMTSFYAQEVNWKLNWPKVAVAVARAKGLKIAKTVTMETRSGLQCRFLCFVGTTHGEVPTEEEVCCEDIKHGKSSLN